MNNAAGELTKLLNAGSVDEGWLVVLTDGDFDNDIPASGLKADLEGRLRPTKICMCSIWLSERM